MTDYAQRKRDLTARRSRNTRTFDEVNTLCTDGKKACKALETEIASKGAEVSKWRGEWDTAVKAWMKIADEIIPLQTEL